MPHQKKIDSVAELANDVKKYDVVAFVDYSRITHQQLEELRRQISAHGGTIRVVKNSLIMRALLQSGMKDAIALTGPSLMILSSSQELTPLKLVHAKSKELETFAMKAGVWNAHVVSADTMIRLASLPGIDVLHAQLVGHLQSPISRMVFGLKGNLQKIVMVLEAHRNNRMNTG